MKYQANQGSNWADIQFQDLSLHLLNPDALPIMKLQYQDIRNAGINKNDIFIQIQTNQEQSYEHLCQIRFTVESNQKQDQAPESEQPSQSQITSQSILKKILEKKKVDRLSNTSIITLQNIHLVSPRGKYILDFYQKALRLHGQTYSYLIEYKHISKGYFLPMENETQVSIVLHFSSDRPIYSGSVVYRYFVIQVNKNEEIEASLNSQKQSKELKLKGLKHEYSGLLYEIIIELFKKIANLSFLAPDPSDFCSKKKQLCIKSAIKAQVGWLYFMKKSLIFIHKPVLVVKLEEIKKAELNRVNSASRHFDLKIHTRQQSKGIQFLNIDKTELDSILNYFKIKNVCIKQEQEVAIESNSIEDEDDADFQNNEEQSSDSESEEFEHEDSLEEESKEEDKRVKKQK